MRILHATLALAFLAGAVATSQAQNHRDDLDPPDYAVGPWAGQGGWTEWDGSVDVSGEINTVHAFTGSQAGMLIGDVGGSTGLGDDMVWDYVQFGHQPGSQGEGGQYVASVMTYVPAGAVGTAWVIMLNRYPTNNNWSLQVHLNADAGVVHSVEPSGGTDLPLIFDEWINVVICIDLDADMQHVYYGGQHLVTGPWIGNGDAVIANIDLYAGEPTSGGTSGTWYDNHRFEKIGSLGQPCAVHNVSPAKPNAGDLITLSTQSPTLANVQYGLFAWEANGVKISPLLVFIRSLDGTGYDDVAGAVPGGLGGLSVGFKSLVANPGGPLTETNTFEVVFQ